MVKSLRMNVAILALSAMAVLPVAGAVTVITADVAFAKNDKGNGGGNDKGNNGGGNDRGNSGDKGSGKSANQNAGGGQSKKEMRQQIIETAGVRNWGAIASELGELNKANANINARLNSSDPVHQALGAYELSGGITIEGVKAVNDAKSDYEAYREGLIGTEVEDPPGSGTLVEITAENIDSYAVSFEEHADLPEGLAESYSALADLAGMRDKPLTAGAIDALNAMLGLSPDA